MIDTTTVDSTGKEIVYNQVSLFIRGIGGFGGDRGPAETRTLLFLFCVFISALFYYSIILHLFILLLIL